MKILTAASYYYYGNTKGVEPQYYYLYKVPQEMGHNLFFFDYHTSVKAGLNQMRGLFLDMLRGGKYDAVFIATYTDEFDEETLTKAKKICPVIAWNSDDEIRWENYSSKQVKWYTYMVTNSFSVYKNNRKKYPNLLHAQWGCTGFWNGLQTRKDIPFSFVGQVYGSRKKEIQYLASHAHLQSWGVGTGIAKWEIAGEKRIYQVLKKTVSRVASHFIPYTVDDTISFEQANYLWNRSKISFTPLESSSQKGMQVKSRVFDMGLSGTLMLAPHVSDVDRYYEPYKEYVPYVDLGECAELSEYYLHHEELRRKIALRYAKRTRAEHMWKYRIIDVLGNAGFKQIKTHEN